MTALLYFIVAVVAAGLATRAWFLDREGPARVAFLGLGWCVAIAYSAFALSLLPGLESLRVLYMLGGTFVPAFALWCVDRAFEGEDVGPTRGEWVRTLFVSTLFVAPVCTGAHWWMATDLATVTAPRIIGGLFTFGAFALTLLRLWEAHEATQLRVEQVRLRYLLAMITGAGVFTLAEQFGRLLIDPASIEGLSISARGVVLQGAFPPFSVLFTGVAVYFIYQTLVMFRLLDLYEVFSRLATLVVSGFLLVLVDGVTVRWVDTFTDYPFHSTFQIFLASVLFLAAYDPLKTHIAWWSNRILNQRGQQLADTLATLRTEIPNVISTSGLTELLLSRLYASGRVPVCSVYLWDRHHDAFSCAGDRGTDDNRPLAMVAAQPFAEGFERGDPWYMRPTLVRMARHDEAKAEVLDLMDAMNADLTLPFVSRRGVVLGWMHLRDEDWSDGFSAEEISRLREIAQLASVVLSNIQDFHALEEKHRLSVLGAMSAGLAHEIRNPLAGIKGAAQYLQGEDLPADSQEMIDVVVHEVDRLNIVVSQFLDYARPFELNLHSDDVDQLVRKTLKLLDAQGLPDGVELVAELTGDLPSLPMDGTRISQVLLNLLQNALQAMPGGGTLGIATRRRLDRAGDPIVEIAVSDTGAGISPDDLEKLFIPFYTTKADGTGLGLSICQRIMKAHGGELEVLSTHGRGSTFIVRLPLPKEEPVPAEESAAK